MAGDDEEQDDDDDDEDEYEDRNNPEYIKPLLGIFQANNEDLCAHLRKDKQKRWRHDHNGMLTPPSEFDEDGEFLDYKYIRSILRADGGDVANMPATRLPDGTKAAMTEMCNMYYKKRNGQAAFDGPTIADAFVRTFRGCARARSHDKPHLSHKDEVKLNADCYERYCDWAPT